MLCTVGEQVRSEWLRPEELVARLERGSFPESGLDGSAWQGWKVEVTAEASLTKEARKFFKSAGIPKADLEAIAY